MEPPKCEFCNGSDAVFEAWFYTDQKLNPYAQGTASAGLMQLRIACRACTQQAIDLGLTQVKEIPHDS